MDEFFVPNLAFLLFCYGSDYYYLNKLVELYIDGSCVVDTFVFVIGFKFFCNSSQKIAEFIFKQMDSYLAKNIYLKDFVTSQIKLAIKNHSWEKAKWFYDLCPISEYDVEDFLREEGIHPRNSICGYILYFDVKEYEKKC